LLVSTLLFFFNAVLISLSGALAPGPMTAAAIGWGVRSRWSGAAIAVGHAVVELPLIVMLVLGMGRLFELEWVKIAIGFAGGAVLIWMGLRMLRQGAGDESAAVAGNRKGPFWTGFAFSAANPYFLIWWATLGLKLALDAKALGVWALVIFALLHWACDLVWLTALGWASFKGTRLLGKRLHVFVLRVCGVVLLVLATWFLYKAVLVF